MVAQGAVAAAFVALYAWQDGMHQSNDGRRYTSGKPQPPPFSRRFCGWPLKVLKWTSLVCLVALGAAMPSWQATVALMALPGAWFVATHPTTVDAPAMLCAWLGSQLMPSHPVLGVLLSAAGGFVHERAPVFCALYAWSPWPLLGLAASGWWRKPAERDGDVLVGDTSLLGTIRAHKPYVDWLDGRVHLLHLRGLWLVAATAPSPQVLATTAVALASRLVGTDGGRFLLWAGPALAAAMPADVPLWVLALHVLTFRRCI